MHGGQKGSETSVFMKPLCLLLLCFPDCSCSHTPVSPPWLRWDHSLYLPIKTSDPDATSGSGNPWTICWLSEAERIFGGGGITLTHIPCSCIFFLSACPCLLSEAWYWTRWIFGLTQAGSSCVGGHRDGGCEPPAHGVWGSQMWLPTC